jgi:hypothetical protein
MKMIGRGYGICALAGVLGVCVQVIVECRYYNSNMEGI